MELFNFLKKISKDFIHRFLSLQTWVKKKGDPIEGGCSFGTIMGKYNWMIYMFQVHLILISSIKIYAKKIRIREMLLATDFLVLTYFYVLTYKWIQLRL